MTNSKEPPPQPPELPVLIVGAGPCGLVAAVTLQKHGIPFVIIERATRSKLCSNAGSGFELAPTAVDILTNGLGMDLTDPREEVMSTYQGMTIMTIQGKKIRKGRLPDDYKGGSVNRAELQNFLLKRLFPAPQLEKGVLLCGSGVKTYHEYEGSDLNSNSEEEQPRVVATLNNGTKIVGCVLLGCDGIHSKVRAVMHGGNGDSNLTYPKHKKEKDPLYYCKSICYWGKTLAPTGSDLHDEFQETQTLLAKDGNQTQSTCAVLAVATSKVPAVFFAIPSQQGNMLNWGITIASKKPPQHLSNDSSGDLTRRGGGVLTESGKQELLSFGTRRKKHIYLRGTSTKKHQSSSILQGMRAGNFPLLEKILQNTPAEDITEAGFFDRKNLDLPYTSEKKLVALLGDAAHPQTPYLGQGVNMAITDAFVYASVIAECLKRKKQLPKNNKVAFSMTSAIRACDPDSRRKANKKTVKAARLVCDISNSSNPIICWFLRIAYRFISMEEFVKQVVNTDYSNRDYWEYFQKLKKDDYAALL